MMHQRVAPATGALARPSMLLLVILTVVALATRFQQFGNPIVHVDEQFYLLVGDRMLLGALPYVDIWDRKPVGLFLIYAGARLLGGSGIIQYQLVATACAIATAWLVERIAARVAGRRGSWLAAILYLLWIPLLTGQGGQSPVFYNLLVAGAALMVLRVGERATGRWTLLAGGLGCMALIGLAIQIKYNVLFEGGLFGLVLLWLAWSRGIAPAWIAMLAVGWIAMALLPTALAMLYYWWRGALDAYWFANFVSIFLRNPLRRAEGVSNALSLLLYVTPLAIIAAHGAKLALRAQRGLPQLFVALWLATAALSIAGFGYYFDHYGLPFVTPACVAAAAFLDRRSARSATILVFGGAALMCLLLPTLNQRRRGTPAQFATLVHAIRPYAGQGLLVWDKLPVLYYVLDAPLPGRFPFPNHLRDWNEQGAVGTDQPAETRRILDARPKVIVIEATRHGRAVTYDTMLVQQRIARDYHRFAAIRVGLRDQLVYLSNDPR